MLGGCATGGFDFRTREALDMTDFRAPSMDTVRIGLIGVGDP